MTKSLTGSGLKIYAAASLVGSKMKRWGLFFLVFGLLAIVTLVVLPDVDPLDFTVNQSASHASHGREGAPDLLRAAVLPAQDFSIGQVDHCSMLADELASHSLEPTLAKLSTLRL